MQHVREKYQDLINKQLNYYEAKFVNVSISSLGVFSIKYSQNEKSTI